MKFRALRARRLLVFGGMVAALAVTAVAAAAVTTVRATSAYETLPAHSSGPPATNNILLWTQRPSVGSPVSSSNVMAKIGAGPAFRVNAAGTTGFSGDTADGFAVYQQNGNIKFQDLFTHKVMRAPTGINTSAEEYHPSMTALQTNSTFTRVTGGWLLFGRDTGSTQKIILKNLGTGGSTVLARGAHVTPGQVNGPDASGNWYADWQVCGITCDVHAARFTSLSQPITKKSLGIGQFHSASGPGVSATGVVTYIQGHTQCGQSVELNKIAFANMGADGGITLVDFRSGFDSRSTYVDGTQVYFDRHSCTGDSNLYRTSLNP